MTKKNKLITPLKVIDLSNASEESIRNLLKAFKDLKEISSKAVLNGDMANEFNETFAKENYE